MPMVLPPGASISEWKGPDMVLMDNYKMMVLLDKVVSLPTVRSGESKEVPAAYQVVKTTELIPIVGTAGAHKSQITQRAFLSLKFTLD